MAKTYTIQNDKGDRGWIQYIDEDGILHDEIMGYTDRDISEEINKGVFLVIDKMDYEMMYNAYQRYNETDGDVVYLEIIEKMTNHLLTKHAKRFF